jgi:hemoglobin-like flavoprotein
VNTEQIMLLQSSWQELELLSDLVGDVFYKKLFELAPDVRPLFKGDAEQQAKLLMSMIGVAVNMLDKPESMVPGMAELGQRHHAYGVEPQHYEPFIQALLWTIEKALGPAFSPEVEEAWREFFKHLAKMMA